MYKSIKIYFERLFTGSVIADGKYRLNIFTLFFYDKAVEQQYRQTANDPLSACLTLAIGAAAFVLFDLVDIYMLPEAQHYLSSQVRYITAALLLAGAIISIKPYFQDKIQELLLSCCGLANFSVLFLLCYVDGDARSAYYAGLTVIFLFQHFARLEFLYGAVASFVVCGVYAYVSIAVNPIQDVYLISNNLFLWMAFIAASATHFMFELRDRTNFIQRSELQDTNVEVGALLLTAEAANDSKAQFLAIISHELRTPLNAIIGFSELLSSTGEGEVTPRVMDYLTNIHDNGNDLYIAISRILDFAKGQYNAVQVNDKITDVNEMMQAVVQTMRNKAAQKSITLQMERPVEEYLVKLDQRLIMQALLNLISNSIKFTPRNGKITVSAAYKNSLKISVTDTGIGMSPEALDAVFNATVSHAPTTDIIGLGLPFVKQVAEMHDGHLQIQAIPDGGTIVTMEFEEQRIIRKGDADAMQQQILPALLAHKQRQEMVISGAAVNL